MKQRHIIIIHIGRDHFHWWIHQCMSRSFVGFKAFPVWISEVNDCKVNIKKNSNKRRCDTWWPGGFSSKLTHTQIEMNTSFNSTQFLQNEFQFCPCNVHLNKYKLNYRDAIESSHTLLHILLPFVLNCAKTEKKSKANKHGKPTNKHCSDGVHCNWEKHTKNMLSSAVWQFAFVGLMCARVKVKSPERYNQMVNRWRILIRTD